MTRAPRPPMGIATPTSAYNKQRYKHYLDHYSTGYGEAARQAVHHYFDDNAQVKMGHPINEAHGASGYIQAFLDPLANAFAGLQRQDYIVIGGEYLGSQWVTSTGYFYGHFKQPLFGIPPTNKMGFLRYGEFLRIENDVVVEAECYLGLAELIIAIGRWPLGDSKGYEGVVPGPATHDGINLNEPTTQSSQASATLVEDMLMGLASEDKAWRPYWSDNMVWYGPGGFGTYATVDAFEAFQVPFEKCFQGWGDGQNEGLSGIGSSCKAGDGNYAFLSGWPQITGIHVRPFLGIEPTGKRVYMRDCDWWRCENGTIIENWCMLDTLHLALQLGRDVLAEVSSQRL